MSSFPIEWTGIFIKKKFSALTLLLGSSNVYIPPSSLQIAPDGNWMHLHYQSKLQAKKALSKNGKVFGNSIMVGVSPCIDKVIWRLLFLFYHTFPFKLHLFLFILIFQNVMADVQEVSNLHHSSYLDASYSRQVTPAGSKTSDRLTPIRPLTAAYKAASSDHEVRKIYCLAH